MTYPTPVYWRWSCVCAWCNAHLQYIACEGSHGICESCIEKHFPEEERNAA